MGMGKQAAPPPPDYAGAAAATAAGNKEAALATAAANRVNQYTPYGSYEYTSRGKDASGNEQFSLTQKLSADQQKLFDQNARVNQALGDVSQKGVGYVASALDKPLNFDGMYNVGTPEQLQQQASDTAYNAATRYLDPQFQHSQADLENKLANQGITRGSEAWNREMETANMQKEQAYGQARNQAYQQGMMGAQQLYGQGTGLRQQQIAEAQTLQQNPINMLNAVRTGSQMQVAQQPQQMQTAQMGQYAGPDLLGAATAEGQYNQGIYNAQQAGRAGMMGSMIGAGGMLGAAAIMSDPTTKENIVKVGKKNGFNLYEFDYKDAFKAMAGFGRYIGVMADEVKKVRPDAVVTGDDGIMRVNYSMLGLSMVEV